MKWTRHVSVLLFMIASIAQGQFNAVEDATTDTGNVFVYENPKGFGKVLDLVNLPQKTYRSVSVREDFIPFEGMEIASIEVIVFDEKNQVIEDTTQWDPNLHFVSKPNQYRWNAQLVKRQLMICEGDLVDAQLMVDNEVVLRQRTIYRDAVIQLHIIDNHRVKVHVLVQNNRHWQVLFEGGPGSIQLGFGVYDIFSIPQSIQIAAKGNFNKWNPYSVFLHHSLRNIFKSGLDVKTKVLHENTSQEFESKVQRKFLAFNTKWAFQGKVSFNKSKLVDRSFEAPYDLVSNRQSLWLARSFSARHLGNAFSLSRWTVGLRYLRRGYSRIPESQPFYESEQFVALGVGLVSRDFYEVEELVQFRAYDYLTKGWNIALIGGYEIGEYRGKRLGLALKMNASKVYPNLGHLTAGIHANLYLKSGAYDQASFRLFDQYISNPISLGKLTFRQFVATSATMSMNRTPNDFFSFNSVQGLDGRLLNYSSSLVANFESVFYTPITWWNSRGNFYGFADFALTTSGSPRDFDKSILHHGYGVGIRFQARNLGLNFVDIALGFYPTYQIADAPFFNYLFSTTPRLYEVGSLRFPSYYSPDI